ncbi:sugar ABC transporter substrate-binding protein, partial [bacterium]|nr:sugar ABC transporter substrate-binding protein [bacterium]
LFFNQKKSDEVVFWTLQMGDFSPYMNKVISEFEKQNPDIKIKWVDVPFSEGEKRTLASILSDNPPDLINLNPDFSALLAQKGTLYQIDDKYSEQFNHEIIEALKYQDKLYSLPWYATSAITVYNKDLALKSNIKLPKTYDDILEIAPQIKQKTNTFVMLPNITENDTMARILNKYGVNLNKNITSEKSQKVFEMFKELYIKGYIPKETITQTHREALEKYMSGQIVFFQAGANFLNMIKENSPSVYEITDILPQLTGDLGQNDFSLMNFVIPLRAKHKNEALKFALFLTNYENQLELAKLTNIIAVNKQTLDDDFYTKYDKNDLLSKARVTSAKQLKNIQPVFKSSKNQKEVNIVINTAVQEILSNKIDIQSSLKKAEKKLNEI